MSCCEDYILWVMVLRFFCWNRQTGWYCPEWFFVFLRVLSALLFSNLQLSQATTSPTSASKDWSKPPGPICICLWWVVYSTYKKTKQIYKRYALQNLTISQIKRGRKTWNEEGEKKTNIQEKSHPKNNGTLRRAIGTTNFDWQADAAGKMFMHINVVLGTLIKPLSMIIDINGAYYAYYVFTLFNHIATTRGKTMAGDDGLGWWWWPF